MRENKMNFGIFFTDASFDHKSKTSVIGIINIENKKNYSFSIQANSPQEAEEFGIQKCMDIAHDEKIFNLIIFCDNKFAINKYKSLIRDKELYKNFWKIQLVWLPREFNQIADMLSKNIDEKDINELSRIKELGLTNRTNKINDKNSKKYIKEIDINTDDIIGNFIITIKQFKALNDIGHIKISYQSEIIKELLKENPSIKTIEDLILESEHIEIFENEIKEVEAFDQYASAILKSIRDTIIFL